MGKRNNSSRFSGNDHKNYPGGSMFGADAKLDLEKRLDEVIQISRRELSGIVEAQVIEISQKMQIQFNDQEQTIVSLEGDNLKLRRELSMLKIKYGAEHTAGPADA